MYPTMTHDDSQQDKKPYTNADLDAAEQQMIDAGHSDLAAALRQYTQGNRNMVVGALGESFQKTLENLLVKHVAPLKTSFERNNEAFRKLRTDDYERWYTTAEETRAAVQALGKEVDGSKEETLSAIKGVADSMGKEIAAAVERIGTLEERADQSEAHNKARDLRVAALELRVDADSRAIRAVEVEQAALSARQTALELRHDRLVSSLKRDTRLLELMNKESGGGE